MNDPLQPYRQPMVTATGIILGFVLNFANAWVKGDSQVPEWLAYVIFGLVLVGVVSLIWVLYRVLRTGLRDEDAAAHHQRTLQLFIVGVSCAVAGAVMDMSSNFFGL